MALLWFFLGALVALCCIGMRAWIKKNKVSLTILSWLGLIVGGLFFFFALAWCATSIIEGESQAAMMGLLFFGVPAIIILVFTVKTKTRGLA